jgi:ubiquinone/menaquinone biosynthesis C-methylase UbiE
MPKKILIAGLLHWLIIGAIGFNAITLWHIWWGWAAVGFVIYFLFFALVIVRWIRHTYHFPIPDFMTPVIDNPIRRKFWQNPQTIARRMKLQPGMTVVEIGPGNGSYTKAVADAIQPGGMLYAVDISNNVVDRLRARFTREGVKNVIPKIEDAHHFTFSDESIDRVFAVSCLPEIPDPVKVLEECRRILKAEGLVCFSELIIDPDYPLRRTEKKWAEKAGLKLIQEFGNWLTYQLHFGIESSREKIREQ